MRAFKLQVCRDLSEGGGRKIIRRPVSKFRRIELIINELSYNGLLRIEKMELQWDLSKILMDM
jgi:hypothetical protein